MIPHVQNGDSVPALYQNVRNANAIIDAANYRAQSDRRNGDKVANVRQNVRVQLKNSTGSDLTALQPAAIKGALFTNSRIARKTITLELESPTDSSANIAICETPIKNGQFGWGYISGIAHVKVDVTDEAHTHADLKTGDTTQLKSATSGDARIIWKESGTGTKWTVILWPVGTNSDDGGGQPGTFDCTTIAGYDINKYQVLVHEPDETCKWEEIAPGCG